MLLITTSGLSYGSEAWHTYSSTDEMSGKLSWKAYSPKAAPTRKLDFPYSNVYSQAVVNCSNGNYQSYLFFSHAPNLTGDKTKDGYSLSKNRIKWDRKLDILELKQNWGAKFLHVQKNSKFIHKLRAHNEFKVELNWYNNPRTIFKYSSKGSSDAIKKLENKCGKVPAYITPQELQRKQEELANIQKEKQKNENKKFRENRIKNFNEEISKLPTTKFVANHTKDPNEIISDITKVMEGWGFKLKLNTGSAMKWLHPDRPTKKPSKLLNCGWTFGFPTWANTGVYADGAIYTYFTDNQVFINWIVKARHRGAPNFVKDCRSTGRVENSILSAVAGKKVKIKP